MRSVRQSDRGVSIVEAALVLPIILMFIFGLIDLGMWTFNSNQASNAARDGARAGVIDYLEADANAAVGSPDRTAVVNAVRAHLPNKVEESDIVVSCVRPDDAPVDCDDAESGEDRLRVEVEWSWDLVTPVAAVVGIDEGAAKGSATMAIIGRPMPPNATVPDVGDEEDDAP